MAKCVTKNEVLEGVVLFFLLIPFYGYMLRTPGPVRIFGFLYLACISGYMIFLSPHRIFTPEAKRSLHEVPLIVGWSLFVIWGVLPMGFWGKQIGGILIGFTVIYILFFSARRHGDTYADWGLGSPGKFLEYLKTGEKKRLALAGFIFSNILILLFSIFASDLFRTIIAGALRKMGGIKLQPDFPLDFLRLGAFLLFNFFIAFLVRYDNLKAAGKIIGIYLISGIIIVSIGGYCLIYIYSEGYAEFTPMKGLAGVSSYVLWGTLQELLFLSYFNTRIRKGISSPILSALLTAVVFSIYHLTAYTLMFICFLIGIVWALIFQAEPNLSLLGMSHGISGGFGSAFKIHGTDLFKFKGSVGPFNMYINRDWGIANGEWRRGMEAGNGEWRRGMGTGNLGKEKFRKYYDKSKWAENGLCYFGRVFRSSPRL